MSTMKVAVVYATKGGLGDAGKYAAYHALIRSPSVLTSVVAMSKGSGFPAADALELDVSPGPRSLKAEALGALESADVLQLDVDDCDVVDRLAKAFEGSHAVVACVGSREPRYPLWIASGVDSVVKAMRRAGVKRLVAQSSVAHADEFLPIRFRFADVAYVMRAMWDERGKSQVSRDAIKEEFKRMEDQVTSAEDLDYLLVRPVGLNPREPAGARVAALQHHEEGRLTLSLSKADAGAYLLEQALRPTLHRAVVTIGQPAGGEDSALPLSS